MTTKKLYALTDSEASELRQIVDQAQNQALSDQDCSTYEDLTYLMVPLNTSLDRNAAVERMARAIWAHSTGALCGDPLCRYATVDADADYQCQCTDCQGQAESFARAALDALREGEA